MHDLGPDSPTVGAGTAPESGFDGRAGPYKLMAELGHGGMGTVYLASRDDDAFEHRVAVKILRRGMDTDAIVRRFRRERQILASLTHPYIAALIDGGTTSDGRPYLAMEYVDGQPIVAWCESRQLDTTARLDLFRKVCAAVHHAHQNLVIHRDIKPANVLVTAEGTPKLLDFGIAKLIDPVADGSTMGATVGVLSLMTPEYASPEQVRGEPVTTATDVYSLGVLLYQMLTGRRPYHLTSRAPADIARVVCEVQPPKPSAVVVDERDPETGAGDTTEPAAATAGTDRLRRRLSGDLDTIVLKALAKEPARRYASVDQLSEDVRRHLAGLPVIARADTFGYRAGKFIRRNRAAVAAGGLTVLALVAGIVGTTWQARVARAERAVAERRFDDGRALANAVLFEVHDAIRDLPGSTAARRLLVSRALDYLDRLSRDAGDRADLRRELAAAYVKVGDVQGQPLHPNLGDTAGAVASYRRAAAMYATLGGARSADPALRREVATAEMRLADILSTVGDTAAALGHARTGLGLLAPLAAAPDAPIDVRREAAAAGSRLGDLLSATGAVQEALAERRRVLERMQAIAAAAPDDLATLRLLGVAHQKLAQTLGNPNAPNVGDHAGALTHLEQAAGIFERGVAAAPDNALVRRNLAVVWSNSADVLVALDRPADALDRVRRALTAFEALARADAANRAAQNDLAICVSKEGEILQQLGRHAEALDAYARGLAIHERLAAADPENVALKGELASGNNRVATARTALGQRAGALAGHDRAVTISQELRRANPEDVELQVALALAHLGRAEAYAQFGRTRGRAGLDDLRAAERDYAESVAMLEGLATRRAIEGTDLQTLERTRAALARVRSELASHPRG